MKRTGLFRSLSAVVFAAALLVPASAFCADTYKVDPVHSSLVFSINHLNIAWLYGRFNDVSGTLVFDEANPANSRAEIRVNAANVDTANSDRDAHLRKKDFFDVKKFPEIVFQSTNVRRTGPDTYAVAGSLAMLGKSLPVSVKVTRTGQGPDPWGKYRVGFDTEFTVKRSDFGMNYGLGGMIGDEVRIILSTEAIKQ